MLTSPVWRTRSQQSRALTALTCGLLAGALTTAALLLVVNGLFSPLPLPLRSSLFLGVAVLALLREFGVDAIPLPQPQRQVPREVFAAGLARGSLRFGFELGLGFRTYISASSTYVLASGIALLRFEPMTAFAAACGFALGRAAPSWTRYWNGREEAWDEAVRRLLRWFKPSSVALVAAGMLTVSSAGS
ncbi:MAG: hypothetical protein ABR592_06365 [Nitriliruptorales bacterium]